MTTTLLSNNCSASHPFAVIKEKEEEQQRQTPRLLLQRLTDNNPKDKVDHDTTSTISFEEFIEQLPDVCRRNKASSNNENSIMKLLERVDLSESDWAPYALFDSSRNYTRNLIATDHETFTILLLCWNPKRESPIHDHPCDGCWMKVCSGQVQECRYVEDNDNNNNNNAATLQCVSDTTATEGDIVFIKDTMGYHKIGNPSNVTPAVSLHLYSPPFQTCRIWYNEKCIKPTKSSICHYSEYGKLV